MAMTWTQAVRYVDLTKNITLNAAEVAEKATIDAVRVLPPKTPPAPVFDPKKVTLPPKPKHIPNTRDEEFT
jgi:hypothetical protein